MFDKQIFANRLKELREKIGLNQKECAEKLNISRGSISFYENGERLPDIETIYNMATFFDVSADYLVGLTDVKTADTNIKAICDYTGVSQNVIDRMHGFFVENKKENDTYLAGLNLFFEGYGSIEFFNNFYLVIESSVNEEKVTDELENSIHYDREKLENSWINAAKNVAFEKFSLFEGLNSVIEMLKTRILKNEIKLLGDYNADD
ncbi:MAG: helix-turn-helix transcriptional regulator [Acutalibacteraceae bacterium]|nr:helix-turn-helix transcriptional regulator [Acutalibacteraceae bacterium]